MLTWDEMQERAGSIMNMAAEERKCRKDERPVIVVRLGEKQTFEGSPTERDGIYGYNVKRTSMSKYERSSDVVIIDLMDESQYIRWSKRAFLQ